jgi:hypothetical protein
MPNRAKSYLEAAAAMSSIPQHAVLNGMIQSELRLAQFTT